MFRRRRLLGPLADSPKHLLRVPKRTKRSATSRRMLKGPRRPIHHGRATAFRNVKMRDGSRQTVLPPPFPTPAPCSNRPERGKTQRLIRSTKKSGHNIFFSFRLAGYGKCPPFSAESTIRRKCTKRRKALQMKNSVEIVVLSGRD